jgi:hypothetical protein
MLKEVQQKINNKCRLSINHPTVMKLAIMGKLKANLKVEEIHMVITILTTTTLIIVHTIIRDMHEI